MSNPVDLTKMPPEIQEAVAKQKAAGRPVGWILETVDTTDPYAVFAKLGKPWYRSDCHCYQGYWLLGGTGSVQCKAAKEVIPGMFWDLFCRENKENCPYRKARMKENAE